MGIRDILSKEYVVNGLKSLGKFRIKISHGSIMTFSALLLILFIAFTVRIFQMQWEIQSGSMHLSEFDPYFQYRFTEYLVKNGFVSWAWPEQWWDMQRWYPFGINVARAGFPGLPFTAAFLYKIISALGLNIDLMDFCALFPPIMGMLACIPIYFLGKDVGGKHVGLIAALFLALSPSYIQRTSLGFFDDEAIGIFALLVFMIMFLRSIEENRPLSSSVKYALGSGLALGYFCSGWGAAFYPIGVTVLFVFVLILLRRYTHQLLLSYSLTFGLGLFIAINVPKLTPTYLTTVPILPIAGVLVLLCLYEISRVLASTKWKVILIIAFLAMLIGGFGVLWQLGYMHDIAGKFWSVINPFERAASPLTESVAEHRISAWGSLYYEFGIGIIFFLAGFFFVMRNPDDKNLFLLILGLTSLYFSCSMVRLLVLIAPAFSLLASIGVIGILKPFNTLFKEPPKIFTKKKYSLEHVGREFSGTAIFLIFLILMTNFAFSPQSGGMPRVYTQADTPVTISGGSLSIVPNAPVKAWMDALGWLKSLSTAPVVCSWWDYGYWLTILGNATSLCDNATINTTQIENVGFTFMANETISLKMLEQYDVKYVLVFVTADANGNWLDGAGGDNGKWMWMARISGKNRNRFINNGFIDESNAWINESSFGYFNTTLNKWIWNARGVNSTIYKLMSWAKTRWCESNGVTDPDAVLAIKPEYFDEAYFAWPTRDEAINDYRGVVPLVCIYEVNWQKYYSRG